MLAEWLFWTIVCTAAVMLARVLFAPDTSACAECGHEFTDTEHVFIEIKGITPVTFCRKCWQKRGKEV